MAPRRFASSITLSGGAKTNSASLSTNFLISHGQATRSTLTRSRVIHFIGYPPSVAACFWAPLNSLSPSARGYMRGRPSPRSGDFRRRVAVSTLDRIDLKPLPRAKVRVDIFSPEMVEGRLHLVKMRKLASTHSFVFGAQKRSFIRFPRF